MQSKTSFFNGTLFRKNLTRFWPLWGLASFLAALFPLALLVKVLRDGTYLALPGDPAAPELTRIYYSVVGDAGPVLFLIYGALCALAVWSYLYSPRSVGLLHTLPIRREGLFLTSFLSGLAMVLLPCAAAGALSVLTSSRCWRCWDRRSSSLPAPPSCASSPATPSPWRRCTSCSTSWR